MVDTKVELCGVTLDNPVIPASGTFGYGKEFAALYDLDILGSISFKGTTREERYGNPLPRIAVSRDEIHPPPADDFSPGQLDAVFVNQRTFMFRKVLPAFGTEARKRRHRVTGSLPEDEATPDSPLDCGACCRAPTEARRSAIS